MLLLLASPAYADKVAVLSFTAPRTLSKPEVEQARTWTRQALLARGDTLPSDSEMLSAEMAIQDGLPDTSQEYRAAGRASSSQWTVTGHMERVDVPPGKAPDGTPEDGYTTYRIEIEACQVQTGRVESLARDVDADHAPTQIGEMLALLLRPEGLANADIPWQSAAQKGRPAKPKAPAPPLAVSAPPPPASPPPRPTVKHAYAEGHPAAIGASIGVSNALARPDAARGPSWAMPLGATLAYAPLDEVPGLELRGVFTSQVIGPKALAIAAGGRYAIPVLPQYRVFIGPELLLGAHVAIGADKTARFLTQGAAFGAVGIGEQLQLEIAGDLAAALGGSGTLLLGGGTARVLVRF